MGRNRQWHLNELACACQIAAEEAEKRKDDKFYNPAFPEALRIAAQMFREAKLSVSAIGSRLIVEPKQLRKNP